MAGITFVCFFPSAFAQDTTPLLRKPYTLHIAVDKQNFYEQVLPATVYVYPNNRVQLYAGETVFLEAQVANGTIARLRAVPVVTDSSNTIIINFYQTTEGIVHQTMILKVSNPFGKTLQYHARMFLLNQNKWVETSTLPVIAKLVSYETWQDIIISIALGDWKLGMD